MSLITHDQALDDIKERIELCDLVLDNFPNKTGYRIAMKIMSGPSYTSGLVVPKPDLSVFPPYEVTMEMLRIQDRAERVYYVEAIE